MNIPTVVVLSLVIALFCGLLAKSICDKKKGKHSCSCGGDCSACGGGCKQ